MLQHQAYAACDDEVIRTRVRTLYAQLVAHVKSCPAPTRSGRRFLPLRGVAQRRRRDGRGGPSSACDWVLAEQADADSQATADDQG